MQRGEKRPVQKNLLNIGDFKQENQQKNKPLLTLFKNSEKNQNQNNRDLVALKGHTQNNNCQDINTQQSTDRNTVPIHANEKQDCGNITNLSQTLSQNYIGSNISSKEQQQQSEFTKLQQQQQKNNFNSQSYDNNKNEIFENFFKVGENNNSMNPNNSNSNSYSMQMNLINANCISKPVRQISKISSSSGNSNYLTSFSNVNLFIKGKSKSAINSQNNDLMAKNGDKIYEEDDSDKEMNIDQSTNEINKEMEDQEENMDNIFDFTIVESISLYSEQPLDWFQSLFKKSQYQAIGNQISYQEIQNAKLKIIQSMRYFKFERISLDQQIKQADKSIGVAQNNQRNLQLEMYQTGIVEAFISVFQEFEQDKEKSFHYIDNKLKNSSQNLHILFKWVKIGKNVQNSNSEQNEQENNKQKQQNNCNQDNIKYQYNHFFKNHNKNQECVFTPIALISAENKQIRQKLDNWGIQYHDLKDTKTQELDEVKEHNFYMKYGQYVEKGFEAILIKNKFVNNLWMRILNERLSENSFAFEIISSFDFVNSQVAYPKLYFCGSVLTNEAQLYKNTFQQQQNQSGRQREDSNENNQINYKHLSIFSNINKKEENSVYNLKLFGNIPQFLVKKFANCLQELGVKCHFHVFRAELTNWFSLDVMNHLLNFSDQEL